MIQIGTYNYLKVKESNSEGFILTDSEQQVLLPDPHLRKELSFGDELLVFVYHNKNGGLIATTDRPYACAGDFAFLKVVDKTENGAFLDIGIDKDLFIPTTRQKRPMEVGREYVVYVYLDKHSQQLIGSSWLEDHADTNFESLEEGEEVNMLICEESELGYSAVFNNRYLGLLYRNEVYERLSIGETRLGYIKKIRKENLKIDLSLRQVGFDFILDSKEALIEVLKENGGVLNLGDKSSPDDIRDQLKMSKKAFKQVIGGLYKERLIKLSDNKIELISKEPEPDAE